MEASSPTTPPETYDDQKPLLENSSDAVNPSIQNDNLDEPADVDVDPRVVERSRPKHVKVTIEKFAFVLLNLIGILISCSGRLHSPLVDQYLYKVFAGPLAGNQSQHTASNPCFSDNSTLNTSQKEQQVQAMTSQMLLELD
ncbi:uncharacterized protein LOC106013142, partial [Aplysia californica]|uniref:Uncharacterized protein LOC106013142 n=1 Tax=Aplysia californica TaxID=6500 RepID=A0ABM1A9S2_APLCA